jgi:hypothetical protein
MLSPDTENKEGIEINNNTYLTLLTCDEMN